MKRTQNPSIFAGLLAASLLTQAPSQTVAATRPTLLVSYPSANLSITNAAITVSGKTSDKVAVTNVLYQLNGAGWTQATTTNHWANWTASVTAMPGLNTLQAYAEDASANLSLTNTVKFTYVVNVPLTVQVIGQGTVSPNDNGKPLQLGKTYTLTATPKPGFAFYKWTGSQTTTTARVSFTMASNLTFTANFVDVQRPVLAILSPAANAKVTAGMLTVTGKAGDNAGVVSVFYQLNGTGWNPANTANNYSNWTASVSLSQSNNTIQAYAQDAAGNKSLTNTVKFTYGGSGTPSGGSLAPSSISGLSATVASPNDSTFTVTFGAGTFSQTMLPGTNLDDNAVGTYSYTKLGTNAARLEVVNTAPPSVTNDAATSVWLTFTGTDAATFAITNREGMVDSGTISFAQARNVAPASVSGKTYHSVSDWDGSHANTVFTSTTVTMTDPAHPTLPNAGTYTYQQYSPVGGLCSITLTKPASQAGAVIYILVTFSASNEGSYYQYRVETNGSGAPHDFGRIVP